MVKRPYHAPRRQAQADATRRAVIEVAHRLFVDQGYAATSIRQVSDAAQVGEQTVYRLFGSKPSLLREVLFTAVARDGPEATGADGSQPDVGGSATPSERLRLIARWSAGTFERGAAELESVVFTAAEADPRVRELAGQVRELRYRDVRGLVEEVAGGGRPPPGMTLDQIADYIYAIWSPPVYRLLVVDRGWTTERFIDWTVRVVERMFLEGMVGGDRGEADGGPAGGPGHR